MSRPDLPFGTVTFLFTDVEGSTKLRSTSWAPSPMPRRWPPTAAPCARPSPATAGSRSTPRATPASWPSGGQRWPIGSPSEASNAEAVQRIHERAGHPATEVYPIPVEV
jgi:hypothetical protein